jgi:protein-tyrosine phosphatase
MFDIHYHLLFGVDDGPTTIESSLKMARASRAEGVSHIVCTPHANYRFPFRPELNREILAMLNAKLDGSITLGLGCEFQFSCENIEDIKKDPTRFTINGKRFLLVELQDFGISPVIDDTLYQLAASGIVPIIAHPERSPFWVANPERMAEWIRWGCLVQITCESLSGRFGRKAQLVSRQLLDKNWVHFVASDAHGVRVRMPAMAVAYKILNRRYGKAVADRLCLHNPRAVFFGEPLPPQPAPVGVFDDTASLKYVIPLR